MTITNHMRYIVDLAELVIEYVDDREYRQAHNALYDIESKTRLAHEHIDKLQQIKPFGLVPAGGE